MTRKKCATVWLVIFTGTNFRKIGQNSDFRNFRSFNFCNLGPSAIVSALGLAPLSGSCVCVYIAFWITSVIAVKGTLADTLL